MDNCPACGALYALVGRVHRCVPRHFEGVKFVAGGYVADHAPTETYKYRKDIPKRRAQIAKAMREYRARKRNGKHEEVR